MGKLYYAVPLDYYGEDTSFSWFRYHKEREESARKQIGASSEIKGKPGGSYLGGSEKGVSRKRVTSYTKCHWTHHKG